MRLPAAGTGWALLFEFMPQPNSFNLVVSNLRRGGRGGGSGVGSARLIYIRSPTTRGESWQFRHTLKRSQVGGRWDSAVNLEVWLVVLCWRPDLQREVNRVEHRLETM